MPLILLDYQSALLCLCYRDKSVSENHEESRDVEVVDVKYDVDGCTSLLNGFARGYRC